MQKNRLAIETHKTWQLRSFLVLLLSFMIPSISAQESDVKVNHEGKEFTQLKHAWTSQWITHPTESTLDARKFLFRRT